MQKLIGTNALRWNEIKPGEAMIVVSFVGGGHAGYKFSLSEFTLKMLADIADDACVIASIKTIKACGAYSADGVISADTFLAGQRGESTYSTMLRALINLHGQIVALNENSDDNWRELGYILYETPWVTTYIRIIQHIDSHLVRGLANLPDDLVNIIKKSCPKDVVDKGLHEILLYLQPKPGVATAQK